MATPRVKRNRRPLHPFAQVQPPLVDWGIDEVLGGNILVAVMQPFLLNGIPAFTTDFGGYVIEVSVSQDGDLVLVMNENPPPDFVLSIGAYDPAVRTSTGGYLVPGSRSSVDARAQKTEVQAAPAPEPPAKPQAQPVRVERVSKAAMRASLKKKLGKSP